MAPPHSSRPSSPASSLEDDLGVPPFIGMAFSLRRLSPLYLGRGPDSALERTRLDTLSRQLRDILVGDTVRGVQVGFQSGAGALGRTGALLAVRIRWVAAGEFLGKAPGTMSDGSDELETRQVLWIELEYENAMFTALLLPRLSGEVEKTPAEVVPPWSHPVGSSGARANPSHFLQLPLLLLRMPAQLQSFVCDFLASSFDCKVSTLRLGTHTLVRAWEDWIGNGALPASAVGAKDVTVTLGFHVPGDASPDGQADHPDPGDPGARTGKGTADLDLGIKTIDIIIAPADIRRLLEAGRNPSDLPPLPTPLITADEARKRRRLAGPSDEEGWHWRPGPTDAPPSETSGVGPAHQPCLDALARYLDSHLALNLYHPGVRVVRMACSAFVLAEGKFKVLAGSGTGRSDGDSHGRVWKLVALLAERAARKGSGGGNIGSIGGAFTG